MTPEIRIPLNIPDVEIVSSEISKGNNLIIRVRSVGKTARCGCCGSEIHCTEGYGEKLELRHLPVFGMETLIVIRPRVAKCKTCWNEPKTTQVLSWYQARSPHTKAYDEYLMKQLINSTIEDVSLKEQVGYDAVVGALNRQVDCTIDWSGIKELSTLGIDEIAMRKGHKSYAVIITAKQSDGTIRILAVLPDRKKATVRAFLEQIPARLRTTIRSFTSDLYESYTAAIDEYLAAHPDVKARRVIDRFHVAQLYREDFDDLRKTELKRLKKELPKATFDQDCQKTLWILRKNQSALDQKEQIRLNQLLTHSPLLRQAYSLREELTTLFNKVQTLEEAELSLTLWIQKVEASSVACYDKFIQTLRTHWKPILNYFVDRVTSGFVEGLNNKIKTIKRRCYGIRKTTTLFQRIWLDLEGFQRFFMSTP